MGATDQLSRGAQAERLARGVDQPVRRATSQALGLRTARQLIRRTHKPTLAPAFQLLLTQLPVYQRETSHGAYVASELPAAAATGDDYR